MSGYNILLVEDCRISAMTAQKLLSYLGHKVIGVAASGEQSLDLLEELRPDIVLMDVNLAGKLNGVEAARIIVENFDLPVVLVTGESDEDMLESVPQSLATGFVKKPINLEELKVGLSIACYKHDLDKKLRASEKKFRNIFNNSAAGIYVCDPSGIYLDCNETFAEILGYSSAAELLSSVKNIDEQIYVEPGRRAELLELLSRDVKVMDFESEVYGRDGDAFWISEHCQAELDADGQVLRYEAAVLDVTARIEAELAYRSTLDLLQRTIDTLPEVIFLLDLECNIILCNDSFRKLFGRSNEEILGSCCKDFICGLCSAKEQCYLATLKREGDKTTKRFSLEFKGISYGLTVAPFCDPKGAVIGAVHTLSELPLFKA